MTLADTQRVGRTFTGARWTWSQQRWISPVVLLLLWELAARSGYIPARVLAAPSTVFETMWHMIVSGELGSNLLVSLLRVLAGLAIGVSVGVTLALISGLSRVGETIVDSPVQMLRTLPVLALLPLFIVWFGIGETPKIALIALATVFPIYLNFFSAIRGVDPRLIEAARSFGLSQRQLIWDVVLPGAMPGFLLGLRFALAVSWLVLVVAEQINANAGLGYLISDARDFFRTDVIVVCLLVYAFLGLGTDTLVRWLEKRLLVWRPTFLRS